MDDAYDPAAARMMPPMNMPMQRPKPTLGSLGGVKTDLGEEPFDTSNMSEEDIQKLVELGVLDEDMAENKRQMELADKLRYAEAPEGRNSGRVYTAANPLEHVGHLMQQYRAGKKEEELEKARVGIGEKQTSARKSYWDMIRGARRKPIDVGTIAAPDLDL
jgi:hypothetical protein